MVSQQFIQNRPHHIHNKKIKYLNSVLTTAVTENMQILVQEPCSKKKTKTIIGSKFEVILKIEKGKIKLFEIYNSKKVKCIYKLDFADKFNFTFPKTI